MTVTSSLKTQWVVFFFFFFSLLGLLLRFSLNFFTGFTTAYLDVIFKLIFVGVSCFIRCVSFCCVTKWSGYTQTVPFRSPQTTWVGLPVLHRKLSLVIHLIHRSVCVASLWLSGKRTHLQCRRCDFNPWVRKVPLEKEMATHLPGILPGKSHGQRSLVGWRPGGCKSQTQHSN